MTPIAAIQASLGDGTLPDGRWLLACSGGLDSMALLQAILSRVVTIGSLLQPLTMAFMASRRS